MMNNVVKSVAQVAVGVIIGNVAGKGLHKVVKVVKEKVKNSKKDEAL